MADYPTNEQRTAEYLKHFDRAKTLKHLIPATDPVVLDIGANVGAAATEFKEWWPLANIHCFEPQFECWPSLDALAARSPGTIVINRYAVGNKATEGATFYSHAISTGISGFNRINLTSIDSIHLNRTIIEDAKALHEYQDLVNRERTVQVVRLDEYLNSGRVDRVDLLKIDTQGSEPEVLEGLGSRLQDVDVILTELMFYDYYERSLSFSDLEKLLLPAGFRLYDISHIAKNPMNGRTDWVDVIYVHRRVRDRARRP